MVCEKVNNGELKPADTVADWQDGDSAFYLRKRLANGLSGGGDTAAGRVYVGGTSSAVWCLGASAFCKVHAWVEGLELEANALRWVREQAPEVPIPELIYSWTDHDLSRTFLITKRVNGETLEQAWPRLAPPQRLQIADDIARMDEVFHRWSGSVA
jgi:hypothetical protein